MGTKTKLTLAAGFVGVVAMAAAAFGQTGADPSSDESTQRKDRLAAAHDGDRCGQERLGRRLGRLVHSEAKIKLPEGYAIVTVDTGKVTAIDHSDKTITIKRDDGETVKATAVEETTVCVDGEKAAFDAIK